MLSQDFEVFVLKTDKKNWGLYWDDLRLSKEARVYFEDQEYE